MTSRIANLASSNTLVGYLLKNQARLNDMGVRISSEKKSQTYEGLATDSERLVNLENTRSLLNNYSASNKIMDLRLNLATTTIESMQTTIKNFRTSLTTFGGGDTTVESSVEDIQLWAHRALVAMQGYLNTAADGRFLFSGARVTDLPVDLGLTNLGALQTKYDGAMVKFPTTRDAHLADFSMSANLTGDTTWLNFERDNGGIGRITANDNSFDNLKAGTTITITNASDANNNGTYEIASVNAAGDYITVVSEMLTTRAAETGTPAGNITLTTAAGTALGVVDFTTLAFDQATGIITAGGGSPFSGLADGQIITVANATDAGNNQTYTIDSFTPTTITIKQKKLTDDGGGLIAAGTITASSYYKGDSVSITHRADKDRSFEYDLTAINPAFEKAIRAMYIIAQGDFGTEGGLDQNAATRVEEAKYLLNSALDATAPITGGATGTEIRGNIERVLMDISFDSILLVNTNKRNDKFVAFLETSIADVENVNPTETVTRLLDELRNLEVSYKAIARIRDLSLADFL